METELQDYLRDVLDDARENVEARKLAEDLLNKWNAGFILSPKKLSLLRKMLKKPGVCGRLQSDGGCAWLRKNARLVGLLTPMPGEKILCNRRVSGNVKETFDACPGYRKGELE